MRYLPYIRMIAGVTLLMGAPFAPASAADEKKACSAPDMPMRPIMATHTIPPYPEVSVMTTKTAAQATIASQAAKATTYSGEIPVAIR